MGQIVHGEGDNLSPLEPVITNQDSDTSYQTNSSLSFSDLLTEEPPDEKKIFWDESIGSLMAMGLADPTARSWLGKCIKMADGDLERVSQVLQSAVEAGTMDPVSYMAAALGGKKAKKKREIDDAFAELRAASDRRKAEWAAEGRYGDDTGDGGGDDLVRVQPEPDQKPKPVRQTTRRGYGTVSTRRVAEIVRPDFGNPVDAPVYTNGSGIAGESGISF